MQQGSTLVVRFVGRDVSNGTLPNEQLVAVWRRLQSLYKSAGGPEILATYYERASEQVSAAEPVTSFEKFRR